MTLAWCLIPNWFHRISICCYSLNIDTLFQIVGIKISYECCLLHHPEINVITHLKYFTLSFNRLHTHNAYKHQSVYIYILSISFFLVLVNNSHYRTYSFDRMRIWIYGIRCVHKCQHTNAKRHITAAWSNDLYTWNVTLSSHSRIHELTTYIVSIELGI